jgi:hypothetical protein
VRRAVDGGGEGRRLGRQFDPEARALAQLALDPDRAAHAGDQGLADGETKPGAAIAAADRAVGLGEALEQAGLHLGSDADAGVDHLEAQGAGRGAGGELDGDAALGGELQGVGQQVQQHLAQAGLVQGQRRVDVALARCVEGRAQGQALGGRLGGDDGHRVAQQGGGRGRGQGQVQAAGLDLGEVQQVADDLGQRAAGAADQVQVATVLGRQVRVVGHQGREAQDAVQRGADLVADRGQEVGLGLAGGLGAGLGGAGGRLAADQQGLQARLAAEGQGGHEADDVQHDVENQGVTQRGQGHADVQAGALQDRRNGHGHRGGDHHGDRARAASERGQQGRSEQQNLEALVVDEHQG